MAFYTSREIGLALNGRAFFANSMSLSQEASLTNPFLEGDLVSKNHVPNAPVNSSLKINYYLTGEDYLKDFILLDHRKNITGSIGGIQFSNGYLESYSLAAEPNSPINISASIKICDEVVGSFSSSNPAHFPQNFSAWNFNDAYLNPSLVYSAATISNITRFNWDYSADVSPVYYANQTGLSRIDADRVAIGEKNISCSISCDNTQIPLSFTGEQYAVELICRSPDRLSSETYGISGRISKKTFGAAANSIAESVYSISQAHVNYEPKIVSVDTSNYSLGVGYIDIQSPGYPNKFTTTNNGFSTVTRVTLGDRDLDYTIIDSSSTIVRATLPPDAINGYVTVETSKGRAQHPVPISLSFPAITVTGFTPITGAEHCLVSISGLNFYRVSDVRINNKSCVFDVVDTTGTFHKINAYIPNSPTIGRVSVHSMLRNVSGFSTGNFYPAMEITSFNPSTGTWSGICTLSGKNFTGITNVYFNGIRSPSFTVNNNQQITARTPTTGQGFAKGYISISGFQGGVARSRTIYQPILKITGISLLSGTPDNDIRISGLFDSGYLYFESGGYRVAFGNEYSIFMRSGNVAGVGGSNFILTGYIPLSNFGSAAPAMIEPDGVTRYDKFTGQYIKIGKPVVNMVNGMSEAILGQFSLFNRYSLTLRGENLNYLFGTPYSVILSGDGWIGDTLTSHRNLISTYAGGDIDSSAGDGTTLVVKNVRMTGNPFQEDVWCRIGVVNLAGTGWFPYSLKFVNFGLSEDPKYSAALSMVKLPRTATNSMDTTLYYQGLANGGINTDMGKANNIIAANVSQYASSYTRRFVSIGANLNAGTASLGITMDSGWIDYVFDPVINFGGLYIEQASDMPTNDAPLGGWFVRNSNYSPYLGVGSYQNTQTGQILCYHLPPPVGSARLAFRTGVIFSTNTSNGLTTTLHNNNVVTGVKQIRLFRNASGEPNNVAGFIGLSHILFFD